MCLGVGIGVALSRRERRAATSAADLAGLAGTDTAVPVQAALRSTVVVLDEDEDTPLADAGHPHLQVELARARHPPPGHGDGRVLRLA